MRAPRRNIRVNPLSRPTRPIRRRIFVGCEGEGEQGYAALIQRFADNEDLNVHLDRALLQPGGGDPCAIIELASEEIMRREARHGDPYLERYVFLDTDKLGQDAQRDQRGINCANSANIILIWQRPALEASLLRHLPGCDTLQPPTTAISLQELKRRWPQYAKPMPAARLQERIDIDGAKRSATSNPELRQFLTSIGFT